ncbi:MAG: DNA translocase FtsK [Schwartzia sp.]|nr:DNA translocase FtsK [Schwartzia sp. (in: firmicutes)]
MFLFALRKIVGVTGGLIVVIAGFLGSLLWTTKWSLSAGLARTERGARAGMDAARAALDRRRERLRAEEAARAAEAESQREALPRVDVPAVSVTTRKEIYDRATDPHFSESAETIAEAEAPAEAEKPPFAVVRPKTGTPAREGFMGRLRRRAEERTRMVTQAKMTGWPAADGSAAGDLPAATDEKPTEAMIPSDVNSDELPPQEAVTSEMPTREEAPAGETDFAVQAAPEDEPRDEAAQTVSDDLPEARAEETEPTGSAAGTRAVIDGPQTEAAEDDMTEGDAPKAARPSFSIEYSSGAKAENASETETPAAEEAPFDEEAARDALARAMRRALSEEGENDEPGEDETPEYRLPEVTKLLQKSHKRQNFELEREIEENAETLARTLEDFRVKATIINACHGPAVTRYELKPAPGVKVSKIEKLADDLALALAAFSVRIEPIPGKSAIGVEVPNRELEGVMLRDVLEDEGFAAAKSKLTVGLGIDIAGQAIFADLGEMPHLLIAGATGSGKSVCVNTLITSILFKAKPDEVRFIMIDPKMVELSNYNGIPHLMVPVVTDARKAASVLNWAVQEMEKRYARFAETGVRKMADFNAAAAEEEKMPAIVIIIDELADLMMVAPKDVEDAIVRLAQKARAAGIHLVLATQRPSVNVITGLIKANIPSRISFAVSSQIDSRTILDAGGAEKLLGKGDMLFYPIGAAKPMRVQGAFVSDAEIEELLRFIRAQCEEPEPDEEITRFTEQAAEEAEDKGKVQGPAPDVLLRRAVEFVFTSDQASTSNIQRHFRIGYTRAGRLVDTMEELGILGPRDGSKPRDILLTREQAVQILDDMGA